MHPCQVNAQDQISEFRTDAASNEVGRACNGDTACHLPSVHMPARCTPEQYAAVAAAGEPPRSDDPRFATDDDAWHQAQNDWHEKVREALGHDELTPPGISERRKEWQAAIKTAAAFRKKLTEDPTLAHQQEDMDDSTTRNERRAQQRRQQKARERQSKTAYQRCCCTSCSASRSRFALCSPSAIKNL